MSDKEKLDTRTIVTRALVEIKNLKAKLAQAEKGRGEPIAIIGMACRLPGHSNSPEAFWELLREGGDGIREVPKERFDIDEYYDPDPNAEG